MACNGNPANSIPNSLAPSSAWIEWHKQLKACKVPNANSLFIDAFTQYGSCSANNNELRNYATSQGFSITACYGAASDIYDASINTTSSVFSNFGNIGNMAFIGVIIVLGLAIFMMYKLFQD